MKITTILIVIILGFGAFLMIPRSDTVNQPANDQTNQITQPAEEQVSADESDFISANRATIRTDKGDIVVELFPNDAPRTVKNFATLAKRGFYNNLTFHRVEPGFVIQGGDPNGNGTGGTSIFGARFDDEIDTSKQLYQDGYKQGILAMANSGPNTNGSQFFIMLEDNLDLPRLYTIFGRVVSGMDVVQRVQVGTVITTIVPE